MPNKCIIHWVEERVHVVVLNKKVRPQPLECKDIRWDLSYVCSIKVNSDRAVKDNTNLASFGGVVYDCHGRWHFGYS